VRVKEFSNDAKGLGERMEQAIEQEVPGIKVQILQSEGVGPGVGHALRSKSILAVVFSLIAMLLYIALRFLSLGFAVGAVVALIHDALIVLACFMFFGREISINVIGAILAVLGYSINDTIVIYSSIRTNLRTMAGRPLMEIVNVSLNQTLRRTLLTSFSTGLAVGALFILGGEGLRDFSLAFLVGIVVGTYSSIFIASPITMLFYRTQR
jgi:preprotein translocase subunit SecF